MMRAVTIGLALVWISSCAASSNGSKSDNPPSIPSADEQAASSGGRDSTASDGSKVTPASSVLSDRDANHLRADGALLIEALPWLANEKRRHIEKADTLIERGEPQRALEALEGVVSPAANLLRARVLAASEQWEEALVALDAACADKALLAHAMLERGLILSARGEHAQAVDVLSGLLSGVDRSLARRAALPLALSASIARPVALVSQASAIEQALPADNPDARSLLLAALADALERLGQNEQARAVRLQRYLEEPVSNLTPREPPRGTSPTPAQRLARAEVLLEAHRNERVIAALEEVDAAQLDKDERCRHSFALGLAHRKLRHYSAAEKHLHQAVERCADEDFARRAMYLEAKVISIRDGLRAVPVIETFAERFSEHTMVDDVLFWAGDMYQRRDLWKKAEHYYERIARAEVKDDYCGEARWRLAWTAYERGRLDEAATRLRAIFTEDGCATERFDRARAHYWLGRIAQKRGKVDDAKQLYRETVDIEPLGYYGQLAMGRLRRIAPESETAKLLARLEVPAGETALPALCPGFLAEKPAFERALALLVRGLRSDAADELLAIELPEQEVLGGAHAASLGVSAKRPEAVAGRDPLATCGKEQALLLYALLLDRAGAYRDAHWRLRTDFADALASYPRAENVALWRAAYPMAFRDYIAAAEKEAGVPDLFVQALAREESALDPEIVSWAGAYGLTQLLVSSGRAAGKLLRPPVEIRSSDDLLDPALSARLGAALLASELQNLGNNPGLALAAYNAGNHVARTWWKRHAGEPFDEFAEQMTIKETRGYVKRVLKTWGVYRWLYRNEPPGLPVDEKLPAR